ncbi:MAG: hypothetical protein KGQ61_05335 [Planctomycetes bacterium]|nr:hypothetical protein [Planctomycetota bacterium]
MRSIDISLLAFRWLHILAAIVAMGGLAFAHVALLPALEAEDDGTRARIHEAVRRRWLPWVIGAITALLVSGLVNYLVFTGDAIEWEQGAWLKRTRYHALFGVKFLLAMGVFFLASGLVGRGAGTQWIRDARRQWSTVALIVGLGVVLLSGWMRQLHTGPPRQAVSTSDDGGMEGGGAGFSDGGGEGARFRGGPPGGFGEGPGGSFRRSEEGRSPPGDAPAEDAAPADRSAPAKTPDASTSESPPARAPAP